MRLLPDVLAKSPPFDVFDCFPVTLRAGLFKLTDENDDSGGNIPKAACKAITVLSQ